MSWSIIGQSLMLSQLGLILAAKAGLLPSLATIFAP